MPHISLTSPAASAWQPLNLLGHPETKGPTGFFAQGSRGEVEQHADRAIKSFFELDPRALRHELMMCNDYLSASGSPAGRAFLDGGKLNMPYICGELPSQQEVKNAVQELFSLGFMMGDPCPENFKRTPQGKVVPVDFGLMFQPRDLKRIPSHLMGEIVNDYAKGGFRSIPDTLRAEYRDAITAIDEQLGKRGVLGRMTIQKLQRSGLW